MCLFLEALSLDLKILSPLNLFMISRSLDETFSSISLFPDSFSFSESMKSRRPSTTAAERLSAYFAASVKRGKSCFET